jgi:hypothetical protein
MIDDLARRQIRAATRSALTRAGVLGVVPTPLDAVSEAIGIAETIDISQMPPGMVARRPNALKRILGAVLYRPRVIVVDRSQTSTRARFIEAHELTHKLLPTHETIIRLDDDGRVFGNLKKLIEHEAELGAAELLFQGDTFVRKALEFPVSIAAPIGLAPEFGTSLTAAIRYYPDYHPDAVATVFAGRIPSASGRLRVWGGHESPAFRQSFGPVTGFFPTGLPATDARDDPIASVVREALDRGDISSAEVALVDLRGTERPFVVEAFFNQRAVFVMLIEATAAHRLSRKLDIRVI